MSAAQRAWMARLAITAVVGTYVVYGLLTARNSFGCDFFAYFTAANHWFVAQPIYDLSVPSTGTCGTYQYPPPFVLVAAPFSLFSFAAATWLWAMFLIACWVGGIAFIPVRPFIRWVMLLLTGLSWPLVFGVRIGQVAPILFLVFAIAWRNLNRPGVLGAAVAFGTLIKIQPGILAVWLLTRQMWRSIAVMATISALVAGVAAIVGLGDWLGMATLLRALSDAGGAQGNVAIGAVLRQSGVDPGIAATMQAVASVGVIGVAVLAARPLPPVAGFLVFVVASQLVSPIVWTHYALVLGLPVAWLLERGQWWAPGMLVAQFWPIGSFVPLWAYTVEFYLAFAAVLIVGWRDARRSSLLPRAATGAADAGGAAELVI